MKQPRFEVYPSGKEWRWRLIAANGRILASGEGFVSERNAWRAVDTVRSAVLYASGGEE